MRAKEKILAKKIAKGRILRLMELIRRCDEEVWKKRYSELARKIAMRYRIKVPYPFRKFYCKSCRVFRFPGKDLEVRIRRGKVLYRCKVCGREWSKGTASL